MPGDDGTIRADVEAWLEAWSALVRSQDFTSAEHLFSRTTTGFGTVVNRASSLDELIERQWRKVWTRTEGFTFDLPSLQIVEEGALVVAMTLWSSRATDIRSGAIFNRAGRATIILSRQDGRLVGLHTHFSINPLPERFLDREPA